MKPVRIAVSRAILSRFGGVILARRAQLERFSFPTLCRSGI
jgi:hypothetical protein